MRVVAGVARGRLLQAPPGRTTRPTSDRVREAIFSVLTSMEEIEEATVLDLFAGSGALGIEALSRGARHATFVDSDPAAVRSIEANLTVLGPLRSRAAVVRSEVETYISTRTTASPIDLVFADPPYGYEHWDTLFAGLSTVTGTFVAESGSPLDPGPGWETVKVKKYGSTVVTVVRPAAGYRTLVRQEGEI